MSTATNSKTPTPAGEGTAPAPGRLDATVAKLAAASRSWSARAVKGGQVAVNGATQTKPAFALKGGEVISWPAYEPPAPPTPGPVPFTISHQDPHLAVVEKPWGVVVHGGAGTRGRTLAEGLAHTFGPLPGPKGRGGIVHRLDRGTHGLLVIARTPNTLTALQAAVKERTVSREYLALVVGDPSGLPPTIETPYGRHPKDRKRFSGKGGKRTATTNILLTTPGDPFSWVSLALDTGRTHQVRVHLSEAGFPIVGDLPYANRHARRAWEAAAGGPLKWGGHALVARRLAFTHPATNEPTEHTCPVPEPILALAAGAELPTP